MEVICSSETLTFTGIHGVILQKTEIFNVEVCSQKIFETNLLKQLHSAPDSNITFRKTLSEIKQTFFEFRAKFITTV
jgi:hypothetical protein